MGGGGQRETQQLGVRTDKGHKLDVKHLHLYTGRPARYQQAELGSVVSGPIH